MTSYRVTYHFSKKLPFASTNLHIDECIRFSKELPFESMNVKGTQRKGQMYQVRTIKARGPRFKSVNHKFTNRKLSTDLGLGTSNKQITSSRDFNTETDHF